MCLRRVFKCWCSYNNNNNNSYNNTWNKERYTVKWRWAYNTTTLIPMKELGAEVGGGLIIHHGLIIRTLRYTNNGIFPSISTVWGCHVLLQSSHWWWVIRSLVCHLTALVSREPLTILQACWLQLLRSTLRSNVYRKPQLFNIIVVLLAGWWIHTQLQICIIGTSL